MEVWGGAPARRPERRRGGGGGNLLPSTGSSTPDQRVGGLFTLRACPPTRLHAPNVYAPSYSRSVPCKRLVSVPPWVGPHPQNPTPREPHPPPKGPPPPPHPTPTPPHPPLVRVEGYSKWMVIPSGWLFRVHGYSVGSYFNSKFESNKQGRAQAQSMQKALTASVGHCTFCPVTTRRRL